MKKSEDLETRADTAVLSRKSKLAVLLSIEATLFLGIATVCLAGCSEMSFISTASSQSTSASLDAGETMTGGPSPAPPTVAPNASEDAGSEWLPDAGPDSPKPVPKDPAEDGGSAEQLGRQKVPADPDELVPYLEQREYLGFTAERELHSSGSPHAGKVRVHINQALEESLQAGHEDHPVGAAAIKELFGREGAAEPLGHSVMVKVDPGAGLDSWFWYQSFEDDAPIQGTGQKICVSCHRGGTDFVVSRYPLD